MLFQFQKGSINTTDVQNIQFTMRHFNSKKVRLIQATSAATAQHSSFQFQKGSINTTQENDYKLRVDHFNSKKVRLIPRGFKGNNARKIGAFPFAKVQKICWKNVEVRK